MSGAPHEAINVRGAETGDDRYPPQSAPNQASQDTSNFVDGSGPIFSMYLEMATEEDKKMTENWKADADGILIFTGLFSAAVASLISVSIQDIRPNPVDTSNFYLKGIYLQTVANTSSSLPASPPPFSPPSYAIWVNAFWFLSLVISLTCALLATLLQQWARRYLKVTQPRYSPHKRARIRAFFAEGVDKFLLPWVVETLPTLLHVSLFLFFAGLIVFLSNVDLTIFKVVLSWVCVCTAVYGCITFMPIFRHNSPYQTPLSLLAWHIVIGTSYIVFRVLRWFTGSIYVHYGASVRFRNLKNIYRRSLVQGMPKTAEKTALNLPSEIDGRALMWTFDSLDEDHELERFFAGLPGFRKSKVVDDPLPSLAENQKRKLWTALAGLLGRTFSSDLLPESVKKRRAIISAKAIDPTHIPWASGLFKIIFSDYRDSGPLATEIVQIVRGWGDNTDENTTLAVRATVSIIVARAQPRDDPWFILASSEMQVPESVLRDYAAHGCSLSLALFIHIARQQFTHFRKPSWPWGEFRRFLTVASESNVKDTQPELQHEFCALWNQVVREAQNNNDREMAYVVLLPIRKVYVALHEDTNSAPTRFSASTSSYDNILWDPTSYPVCNVAGHIHDDSASTTLTVPVPVPLPSLDAPSSLVPAPLHVDETLTDAPPLNPTTIESLRIPVTSLAPGPATTHAMRDVVTSVITTPHPTPETSTTVPLLSSTSPPATVAFQHNVDLLTPSDAPHLQSSASSPALVLDDILPTGPPLSSHSFTTRSDLSLSCTESHRSIIVPAAASASPGPTSALDLGVAAEDDDSSKPGLRKAENALDPPSSNRAIHANTMITLHLPPQPPSLSLVTDSDHCGSFPAEPNAGRAGDHGAGPSDCRYDIV